MNKIITLALTVLLTAACARQNTVTSLDVSAFEKAIQDTTVQILDVRTAEEYLEGHLEKASFLDLSDTNFTLKAGEMLDKDKKVAVYCRTGRRSKKAAQRLLDLGYEVLELDTGITGWLEEGLPVQH